MKIQTVPRPYTLTFHGTGTSYQLTSEEAQRLLDEYPAVSATRNKVVLQGHNSGKACDRTSLRPATLGGGPAFVVTGKPATVRPAARCTDSTSCRDAGCHDCERSYGPRRD